MQQRFQQIREESSFASLDNNICPHARLDTVIAELPQTFGGHFDTPQKIGEMGDRIS